MARVNDRTDMLTIMEVTEINGSPLLGTRICITGHMAVPRKKWESFIKSAGGEFHTSVKFDTTHLVSNNDWNSGIDVSSKVLKAKRNGVHIISEQQLMDMILK